MVRNLFLTYLMAALFVFIGIMLPWASVFGISVDGIDSNDGKLMLVLVVALVIAAILASKSSRASMILGVISSALVLIEAVYQISHVSGERVMGSDLSVGSGLYLMAFGGSLGLVGSFLPVSRKING